MRSILKTEIIKLKRYYIIWAGVAMMLLSVLLTLFTSMAKDGSVWDFRYLMEQVMKNNMSVIFPMCITLITGYIISRELKDDTLKNLLTIPISYPKLIIGKLVICGLVSLLLGIVCFLFTMIAQSIIKFPGYDIFFMIQSFLQMIFLNLFLYIAVLPIIVITSTGSSSHLIGVIVSFVYGYGGIFAVGNMNVANIYPITAALGIIGYRNYDSSVNWNFRLCIFVIILMCLIAIISLNFISKKESNKQVNNTKLAKRKGW